VRETSMTIKHEIKDAAQKFRLLSLYQRFLHIVVVILTALIAIIVVAAIWSLSLKILFGLVLYGSLDPSDYEGPGRVRYDLYGDHCARIQEIATVGGRAP
jgi:hypothetical protein